MEDMASLWSYPENIDELKQKLLYTSLELQTTRAEANDEMRKNKENLKQLVQLLKLVCQERDEARDQLNKLLNKVIPNPTEFFTTPPPQLRHESPLVKPAKANSSITESNSLSETYNHHSHSSSQVDSIFDAVSSPELSNINIGDSSNIVFMNQPFTQDYNGMVSDSHLSPGVLKFDQNDLFIDNLVKGKTLPQKGKLLQAVLEAGPLLQTLLVAGPLPRWRNPPPLQAFHIPPVSITGYNAEIVTQKTDASSTHVNKSQNSQTYVEMSCGSSQTSSMSLLNFANGTLGFGSCVGNGRLISAGANTISYIPNGKRQRFQ